MVVAFNFSCGSKKLLTNLLTFGINYVAVLVGIISAQMLIKLGHKIGAIAYQLLTKPLYIGEHAIMATFMRTEAEPELWRHVMVWFLPAQILRGFLMSLALSPFLDTIVSWTWTKRFIAVVGVYLVFGFWASTVAAPGTIEGFVYLRPEFTPSVHLKVQPEIIVQGLLMSAWLAYWVHLRLQS